ncbi:MAG: hypothetical protein M1168_02465 [Candidatus Marsarchaeota archaeon]|nr:hypothetical protein [Candidatus Marsarchaeota archaeon]MCL5094822.1 hypothetical protein [Candidatus Marsarchaeota archaeon]
MKIKNYILRIKIPKINDSVNYLQILDKTKKYKRSSIKINENKEYITILINAVDVSALRGSVNAILKEIQIIKKINLLH